MRSPLATRHSIPLLLAVLAACSDSPAAPGDTTSVHHETVLPMTILGNGSLGTPPTAPYTAEVGVRGATAYTSTWGNGGGLVVTWDVSGDVPQRVGALTLAGSVTTTGDVNISDDGQLLMVATEPAGSIGVYSLADPRAPQFLTRYTTPNIAGGVHTAKFGRVNGVLYAFLSIDPRLNAPAHIVILDMSNPAAPRELFVKPVGRPYVHDVFVRDGLLFLALWEDGLAVWDIGGGGKGGTPQAPVELGRLPASSATSLRCCTHNVWVYKDPTLGRARYAFVGEEGAATVGSTSSGDIHVVDISDFTHMKEVATYMVPGAGTHNFSMDEAHGVLYAAYYNGGVRALDVRGDLSACPAAERVGPGDTRCSLNKMKREVFNALTDRNVYVWGVQYADGLVYASDMLNGLWKLKPPSP
ncbi:MAG TPA: hypothetical protein VGD77_07870 [Gemmatimonadaceae bacterium]